MGLPVVLIGGHCCAVGGRRRCTPARLAELLALGGAAVVAVTARRAETLKARAYDGDLARIELPARCRRCGWLRAVADPAGDLRHADEGPVLHRRAGGDATLHRPRWGWPSRRSCCPPVMVPVAGARPGLTELPA